jgi:CBS domain containing-hemolysin-like protein
MDFALIAVALFLVLLNGFFVASEFAIVKLRRTRVEAIRKRHGLRGALLAKVHANLDAYLSACQLGITLASLGLGWIGEPAFARLLEPLFAAAGIRSEAALEITAFAVAFFIISYLHIVIGELGPKSMAIRRPETMSLWTAAPLYLFYWAMYPVIWVLNASANWMLRTAGLDAVHEHEVSYSAEELKLILRSSRAPGRLSGEEWKTLAHFIDFSEMSVSDVMRPAAEMVALYGDAPLEANLATVHSQRLSRYPFMECRGGAVLGILHVKELAAREPKSNEELKRLLRPPLLVDAELPAAELLRSFRTGAPHLAIVPGTDGIVGFVTFDNVLAALLGEIQDEFRHEQHEWERLPGGALLGKASLPVYTLERALGMEIPAQYSGSVGGLILEELKRVPEQGERVDFEGFNITVLAMRGPRIVKLKVTPKQEAAPA